MIPLFGSIVILRAISLKFFLIVIVCPIVSISQLVIFPSHILLVILNISSPLSSQNNAEISKVPLFSLDLLISKIGISSICKIIGTSSHTVFPILTVGVDLPISKTSDV